MSGTMVKSKPEEKRNRCQVCLCPITRGRRACMKHRLSQPKGPRVLWKCRCCGVERYKVPSLAIAKRCRACDLASRSGSQNANWKGGRKTAGAKIRASDKYKLWRKAVFERDNFTCISCRQIGGELHADHIKPFAYYPRLRFALSNGRTLCKPCHEKTDTYQWRVFKHRKPVAAAPLFDGIT